MNSADRTEANRPLLDEVDKAGLWFHAMKIRPIWAKEVVESMEVDTLEGQEHVPAGAWLCRGEIGELWPQSHERLHSRYDATEEISDGWRKFLPRPDSTGVLAARIDRPFKVEAMWGTLSGKAGDYLVRDFDVQSASVPNDIWIVDRRLFEATYSFQTDGNGYHRHRHRQDEAAPDRDFS